jgi:hypothetical protein
MSKAILSLLVLSGAVGSTSFATTDQYTEVKGAVTLVSKVLAGAVSVGDSYCYLGTDRMIYPGTLPASEPCVSVGFETSEQMNNAKQAFVSPRIVNGVGIAFYVIPHVQ